MPKKRLLITLILTTLSTLTFASSPDFTPDTFDNFQVEDSDYPTPTLIRYAGATLGGEKTSTKYGILGGLFTGIGSKMGPAQNYYLGGELAANLGFAYQTNLSIAASFIPGYMLTKNMMLYGRVGLLIIQYKNHGSVETGILAGLGWQGNLSRSLAIRGEYNYITYTWKSANQISAGLAYLFN